MTEKGTIHLGNPGSQRTGAIAASILIPTKNGERDIEACLEGAYSQEGVGRIEVLLVDSGSTDATLEIARRFPARIESILPESFHHARTRNFAADLAQGEFLVFLSQDAVPAGERWLAAMLDNFRDPAVGAVYGRQWPVPGAPLERTATLGAVYGDKRLVKESSARQNLGYRYYHFSDANAAIRKSVWQATRFPEDFKVFEDLGIAKRILDSGWQIVYEPRAGVYHSHSHTTLELFQRYFDIGFTFRRLGIWNERTRASLMQDAWKLLRDKISRFDGNGNSRKVGASVGHDLAKSAGMFLGLNEKFLPLAVKRRLSASRVYE